MLASTLSIEAPARTGDWQPGSAAPLSPMAGVRRTVRFHSTEPDGRLHSHDMSSLPWYQRS